MPSTELLTFDDLAEIGASAYDADDPRVVAAELVAVVEQGLVADKADTGYALLLAAELTERAGELPAAAALADRAVEAYRVHGDPEYGYPRAFRAALWLQLGRADEAMAEMTALRPLLTRDVDAASYISGVLEENRRAETAEQWVTAALETALQHRQELAYGRGNQDYAHAAEVAFTLAQQRHRLRRALDRPHDAHDDLADQLLDALHDGLDQDEREHQGTAVLFWPQAEFDRLLERWPILAESHGRSWDEHRTRLQRGLVLWSESGHTDLALLAGSVDELADHAGRTDSDPTDPQVRESYAQHLEDHRPGTAWPPGRNEACWCGQARKYKKCCLPRART
jgi:hypothetical protein